jgi:hypothetical protein
VAGSPRGLVGTFAVHGRPGASYHRAMDGMEVDTDQLRDKVANLSGLLVTTMSVVERLRQTTIEPSAFGTIGVDVHAISTQVQDQAGKNIAELSAVFQVLNQRSTDFAGAVDQVSRRDQGRLSAIRPAGQQLGGG